jgi:small subunit ribosomal protein S9
MKQENIYYATGKRKTSVARTWLHPGSGAIVINDKPAEQYFTLNRAFAIMQQPFEVTNTVDSFDVRVRVIGGGVAGQADAIRHGISRALVEVDPAYRTSLKKAGFIRRDPRKKERKKYGQRGARARFQFSKR